MIYFAFVLNPGVTTALPVQIGANASQAVLSSSAPAAANIAPQTPPPSLNSVLAALTIISAFIFVISFFTV